MFDIKKKKIDFVISHNVQDLPHTKPLLFDQILFSDIDFVMLQNIGTNL